MRAGYPFSEVQSRWHWFRGACERIPRRKGEKGKNVRLPGPHDLKNKMTPKKNQAPPDIIVVGGGAAGMMAAGRSGAGRESTTR